MALKRTSFYGTRKGATEARKPFRYPSSAAPSRASVAPSLAPAIGILDADPPLDFCPAPVRHTSDQWRCAACGLVWDVTEDRPPCLLRTPRD